MSSTPYPDHPSAHPYEGEHDGEHRPVIKDKRRIDPLTGRVRQPADSAASDPPPYESLFAGPQAQQPQQEPAHSTSEHTPSASYVAAATKAYSQTQPPASPSAEADAHEATSSQATSADPPAEAPQDQQGTPQGVQGKIRHKKDAPKSGKEKKAPPVDDQYEQLNAQLAERTADLQRLNAEYANYRRRVERERETIRQQAVASVAASLLPLLDDIDRAREHGDLTGGFKSVAEALEQTLQRLEVARFGEPGDVFDHNIHEAMMHTHSEEVSQTTAVQVLQVGYTLGKRLLRPARVAVADPPPQSETTQQQGQQADQQAND